MISENDALLDILRQSPMIVGILENALLLELPNWYLGAGCIAQTVWNHRHGFDLTYNILDCDLVYYDSSDISAETENSYLRSGKELFKGLPVPVEIVNEARVHLWYQKHFGYSITQYKSVEEAIDTWPTTATSIGIRYEGKGNFNIYAPFGTEDLLNMIVRANKKLITREIYHKKVERWSKAWPGLTIVPWGQAPDSSNRQ